jgi:renierapurpurin 18,18'-hydroxylase
MNTAATRFDVRQAGANLNHWYVVARSTELARQPLGVTLWQQEIVIYRDRQGRPHALEDRCPHRYVKLSRGAVVEDELECAYHGWRINSGGQCTHIPYLEAQQKVPTACARHYPVREQDGFIWLFPGDATLAEAIAPLGLPEWEHLNYIATVSVIDAQAHFSYLIENLMDMYHGHLHQDYQAWTAAELQQIDESSSRVDAHYTAQSYYQIDKIWSAAQLFIPQLRRLHPEPLDVSYIYPHWAAKLGDTFRIYCLFCPISLTHTRAYLIHFTSLNAFPDVHKLPLPLRRLLKNGLFGSARYLLDGLVNQDVPMIEDEQRAYLENRDRRPHEINRALVSVQRLIRSQSSESSSIPPTPTISIHKE